MVSSKGRTWLYVGITSFKGKISLTFLLLLFAAPCFAAGGACPSGAVYTMENSASLNTLASYGVTSCYYVSKSIGSDSSYDGTQETVSGSHGPFAHLPGMPSCTNNCAALKPAAGEGFILRGGDTWTASDLGIVWQWNGSSSSPIYIGVDQSWYSGSSWARPIFTCGGSAAATGCSNSAGGSWAQTQVWGTYVTVDNIEFTGLYMLSTGSYPVSAVQLGQPHAELENSYAHGWYRDTGSGGDDVQLFNTYTGGGATQMVGTSIHNNVVDGYDSYLAGVYTGVGVDGGGASIYNNVVRYVFNGLNGPFDSLTGNLIEHIDFSASSGAHCNGIYNKGAVSTPTGMVVANNVIRDSSAPGCVVTYLDAEPCSTCVTYFYNNVYYNWPGIDFPMVTAGGDGNNGGTFYYYNDTISTDGPYCVGNGYIGGSMNTAYYANMHCISSNSGTLSICGGASATCTDNAPGHSRLETLTSANSNGYCEPGVGGCTATWPFAPSSGSSPTVGLGANETSQVSTFGAAFAYDTTLAVGYNSTNHTVIIPGRTSNGRPSSVAWNAGAYMNAASLNPPTGLTAVVK